MANLDQGTDNELTGALNAGEEVVKQLKENHALGWKFVGGKRISRWCEIWKILCSHCDPGRFHDL